MKGALKECHVSNFAGQTAAIDVMVWLYKGAYSCSYELATGQQTLNFLAFPIKMLRMLKSKGIKPICVFDGFHLKAKEATEKDRQVYKKANREKGVEHENNGNVEEAKKYFSRALVLRSRMIDLFMDILIELNIEFVVSPYEADAQMAYMVREGIADFAISEDSDLIAYGCPKILLKLNPIGSCQAFSFQDFYNSTFEGKEQKSLLQLQKLSSDDFTFACIMAGCEYLNNIERVGLKSVLKIFEKEGSFDKVMEFYRTSKTHKDRIPDDYEAKARKVAQLFNY